MHKIRRRVLGIAAGVAFTSFATAGFAGGPSDAEKRAACTSDVMRYCFTSMGNMDKAETCLRARKPQLSGTCKALFEKYDAIPAQPENSAGRSSAIEAPGSERAPTVAQPTAVEPAAAPAAAVETIRPPREAPAVATPSTSEKTAAVPVSPAGTARSLGETPAPIAPSKKEMTLPARPCDVFDCSVLPPQMEKVMRNMPASMAKAMRNVPRAAAKAMERF